MKGNEVHNLKDDELVAKLIEAKQEAFNLRFRHATGELENTAGIGGSRRDVAKLLTVAKERGIDVEKELRKRWARRRRKKTRRRRRPPRRTRAQRLQPTRPRRSLRAGAMPPFSTPPSP